MPWSAFKKHIAYNIHHTWLWIHSADWCGNKPSCRNDESEFPHKWMWWYNRIDALHYYVYQVLFNTAWSVQL
jgi:hypothetical protein